MTKKFLVAGDIIDTDADRSSFEDVTPSQVNAFLKTLKDDDEVVFEFNSCGGSCTAGISIANLIKKASSDGHKTTARVIGLCASIASYIACSCDTLEICSNAFLMVHLPWTCIQGNKRDLETEIKNLQLFEEALVSVYKTKFGLSDDDIKKMLDAETWILGKDAESYGLKCTIIPVDTELKIAAKYTKKLNIFNKVPELDMKHNKEEEKTVETVEEEKTEVTEEKTEVTEEKTEETEEKSDEVTEETTEEETETTEETTEETETVEELKEEIKKLTEENEELKKELDKCRSETVDERVSGMQSKMQSKINALIKEHNDKISNYDTEIKAYSEKLTSYENEVISLKDKLDAKDNELQRTVSALSDRESALHSLNSSVLRPSDLLPSFAEGLRKCKTLEERVEYIKNGKYTIN